MPALAFRLVLCLAAMLTLAACDNKPVTQTSTALDASTPLATLPFDGTIRDSIAITSRSKVCWRPWVTTIPVLPSS